MSSLLNIKNGTDQNKPNKSKQGRFINNQEASWRGAALTTGIVTLESLMRHRDISRIMFEMWTMENAIFKILLFEDWSNWTFLQLFNFIVGYWELDFSKNSMGIDLSKGWNFEAYDFLEIRFFSH